MNYRCVYALAVIIILAAAYSCSDSTTNPDPEPLTLEGQWSIRQFQTEVDGAARLLVAPTYLSSRLEIAGNRFRESGMIYANTIDDSGTVTEVGDSLRFYSQVLRRFYMGKLNNDNLAIKKYLTLSYPGLAIYMKTGNIDH